MVADRDTELFLSDMWDSYGLDTEGMCLLEADKAERQGNGSLAKRWRELAIEAANMIGPTPLVAYQADISGRS